MRPCCLARPTRAQLTRLALALSIVVLTLDVRGAACCRVANRAAVAAASSPTPCRPT